MKKFHAAILAAFYAPVAVALVMAVVDAINRHTKGHI